MQVGQSKKKAQWRAESDPSSGSYEYAALQSSLKY